MTGTFQPIHLLGPALVVVVLIGSGTVAYACGVATGGGCGKSGCPTGGVYWTSVSTPVPSASNVKCTASLVSSTLIDEGASQLLPGQSCTFYAQLENTEAQTVTLTEKVTATTQPASCGPYYTYVDNVPSSSPVASNHYFAYQGKLSFSGSAPYHCLGSSATFTVVITATPYVKCGG